MACLFTVTIAELQAQTPSDSAAIRQAALSRGGGIVAVIEIVRDTAWVIGHVKRVIGPDTNPDGSITDGVAFDGWRARVERRRGKWVMVWRRRDQ
jgi:hypothetical protein